MYQSKLQLHFQGHKMKAGVLFQVLAITNKIRLCYYQGNPNMWVFYCSFSNYKLFQNYVTKAHLFQAVTPVGIFYILLTMHHVMILGK